MSKTKDWVGDNKSIFKQLGASAHCSEEREEHDFYATDPKTIDDLLKHETFDKNIWECAVGQGHLAERLKQYGHNVKCSDLINRGYEGTEVIDFLTESHAFNGDIITNTPYKYCNEFILNSLNRIPNGHKVAMFLKLTTLEGKKRYEEIYSKFPPKTIYVYVSRASCAKNGDFNKRNNKGEYHSAVCYAWFVWIKGEYESTELKWIV